MSYSTPVLTAMLSSRTLSLQSSAMKSAAKCLQLYPLVCCSSLCVHCEMSVCFLTFEKRPSHLKQQQSVACPGGIRFRPPKQQVVCRPLPVCPACSVPQLKKAQPHLFQASSTMFVSQALFRKVSDALAQTTRVCLCASSQVMSSSFLEEHRGLCDERFFSALPHSCSTLPLSNNHIV